MEYWINIILLFFIYAFAGWCMEVILKYRQYHRFINRGFLTGPLCPIYGCGTVLITIVIGSLTGVESGLIMTFTLSFVICGVVEYLTSLILEKIFHARWWDYSEKPMNLQGRVWIGNLLLFGLAGVGIIHILNPAFYKLFSLLPVKARGIIAIILLVILAADFVVSYFVLKLVKVGVDSSEADNTEEISNVSPAFLRRLTREHPLYGVRMETCLSSRLVESIESYDKAIELYPYMGDAYYNRGLVLIYLKDKEKGCIDLSRAGELGVADSYSVIAKYCEEDGQ